MPLSDVQALAESRQFLYQDMATQEDRLMAAYRAARSALIATLPAGTKVDPLTATATQQIVQSQLDARVPALQSSFQDNTDLSQDDAVQMTSEQSRQHYLYKYLIACDGLGVYASGYAKQLNDSGNFPGDYTKSIDDKIRIFSDIVHAYDTGSLSALVNNESVVQQAAKQSGVSGLGAAAQGQPITVIGTKGTTIILPSSSGAAGLGLPISWQGVVVIAVVALVAGTVVYLLGSKQIEANAATTREICKKLIDSGDKAAAESCIKLNKEATDLGPLGNIIPQGVVDAFAKYAFVGGLLVLGVMFLPTIVGSVTQAQTVYQQRKAARAAANRRRLHR